jgi:hypothetical protein
MVNHENRCIVRLRTDGVLIGQTVVVSAAYLRTSVAECGGREMMLKRMKAAKKEKRPFHEERKPSYALFNSGRFPKEEFRAGDTPLEDLPITEQRNEDHLPLQNPKSRKVPKIRKWCDGLMNG